MLNLTIEPTQCILDGISLYESINISILDKLINSKLLKTTFNNKICANIFENEKDQLIKYKALFKKISHAVIKYKRSKGNPYGRCNPVGGLGLHNLRREIRQTLTKGRFTDIDVKNCHPVILLQLIQHAGIPTIQLKSYVENRQDWFNLITGAYQCTEEQAKTLMILYTYGGGFKKWIDKEKLDESFEELPELKAFKNEVRHYHGVITRHNPHLLKVAKKIKFDSGLLDTTNIEGTVCAYFLQEYEVRILETLYNYCIDNNIIKNRVAVLCADGLMIETENYDESLLTIFNKIVKEKIGFDLMFVEKPMTQDYLDILDNNLIESKTENEKNDKVSITKEEFEELERNNFKSIVEEFEKTHAKIINKSLFVKNCGTDTRFMTEKEIITAYKHINIGSSLKFSSFINVWINRYEKMRVYDDVGIYPNPDLCPSNIYNIWMPFNYELSYSGDYTHDEEGMLIILNHIKILCDHDQTLSKYVVKWIANALIYPENKSTMLLFISEEGTGKTFLIELFKLIFGAKRVMMTANPNRDVWGMFNSMMKDAYIVNLNELSKKDTFESEEKIKSLITDGTLSINQKGKDQFDIQSYHRFIGTTNKFDGGITTKNGDRRAVVIRCSDEKVKKTEENKQYFNNLFDVLKNKNAIMSFINFLFELEDIPVNILNEPIPESNYQEELKGLNRDSVDIFIEDLAVINQHKNEVCVSNEQLLQMFISFCNRIGYRADGMNAIKLSLKIKNLFKNYDKECFTTTHSRTGKIKTFNIKNLTEFYGISIDKETVDNTPDFGGEYGECETIEI